MQRVQDWLAAIAIGIAVALIFGDCQQKPNIPDQAPDFAVQDVNGQPMALSTLQGQTVVLNFWASWCGPCRQEAPDFSRFAADYPHIAVLGLAVDSGNAADVRRAASQFGIDYPVAVADRSLVEQYDISAFPTTIVVQPDGTVGYIQVGSMTYSQLQRRTGVNGSTQP